MGFGKKGRSVFPFFSFCVIRIRAPFSIVYAYVVSVIIIILRIDKRNKRHERDMWVDLQLHYTPMAGDLMDMS